MKDSAATHSASAPGRVNLIGEHTDYNAGFVLPTLIPQRTTVALQPRDDLQVRVCSAQLDREQPAPQYSIGSEARTGGYVDYVQGVTAELLRAGHGERLRGFELRIDSTIPLGSGLSSSAALEISLLRALRAAFALPLSDRELATLGQRAENNLVGAPCGIMDQLVVSLGEPGSALFIDTRSLAVEAVALPPALTLMVIHSGVSHRLAGDHAGGDYKTRRAECAQAARLLGVATLREVPYTAAALAELQRLPEPLGRRARHVVSENDRVLRAVAALRAGGLRTLGALLNAGHESLRDDFAVSLPAIDLLVRLAAAAPAVLGARLTGGGFGGAVVMLSEQDPAQAHATATRIATLYKEQSGNTPVVLLPAPPASSS